MKFLDYEEKLQEYGVFDHISLYELLFLIKITLVVWCIRISKNMESLFQQKAGLLLR